MKKILLTLSIATVLTGCGELFEEDKQDKNNNVPASTVTFDPANGILSVPNDLLMSGTLDGTLNMPGELNTNNESISRAAYADPQLGLGALDGWSTQVPFKIDLTFADDVTLDDVSAATIGAVRIFEVVMGASLTDEECAQVEAGIACKFVSELDFGVDFITKASGDAVAVIPLKPFKAGSTYINVLTTNLKDSLGRSIDPSFSYRVVKQETSLVLEAQHALQNVVNSYENVVVNASDLTKDDIIFSSAMTMQSAGPVLSTVKSILAASLSNTALPLPTITLTETDTHTTVRQVLGLPDTTAYAAFNAVEYQKGSISLPMYLGTPTGADISDLSDTYWQAMCSSPVAVLNQLAANQKLIDDGKESLIDPTMFDVGPNEALCLALSNNVLHDYPKIDITRHLSKYNPIPNMQSLEVTPVQITKPIEADINVIRSGLGLADITKPASGWPIVIMQHGITTTKESMLALTAQLSIQGFATVAIDHPRHGERGINIDGMGDDDFNASTGSILSYMDLSSLLVARDSLRQSSADLLALRLSLNFLDDSEFDSKDVSYVGHSLGAVVAPVFIAQANSALNDSVDPLFKVNTVALASGGGGIASFLLESGAFGPFIQGSILSQASTAEADEFNNYLQTDAISNCGTLLDDTQAYFMCGYNDYMASLTMANDIDKKANIDAVMTQFKFAAQTVLDSGDPTNYAATVKALKTPIYTSAVVGDGAENKADQVIAPLLASNPIAGTIALSTLMGLETTSRSEEFNTTAASYLVKFTQGHHGSVLTPLQDDAKATTVAGSAAANTEMQLQIATYLASRGHMLVITNSDIVTN